MQQNADFILAKKVKLILSHPFGNILFYEV